MTSLEAALRQIHCYTFFRGLSLVSCVVPDTRVNGIYPSDQTSGRRDVRMIGSRADCGA